MLAKTSCLLLLFTESSKSGAYGAVAFSYGNGLDASNAPGMSETVGYHPPFSVPENLLHSLVSVHMFACLCCNFCYFV